MSTDNIVRFRVKIEHFQISIIMGWQGLPQWDDAATATAPGHCYTDDLQDNGENWEIFLKKGWRQSSFLKVVDTVIFLSSILAGAETNGTSEWAQMNQLWFGTNIALV